MGTLCGHRSGLLVVNEGRVDRAHGDSNLFCAEITTIYSGMSYQVYMEIYSYQNESKKPQSREFFISTLLRSPIRKILSDALFASALSQLC